MFVLNDFNSKKNTLKYSNSVNIFVYIMYIHTFLILSKLI